MNDITNAKENSHSIKPRDRLDYIQTGIAVLGFIATCTTISITSCNNNATQHATREALATQTKAIEIAQAPHVKLWVDHLNGYEERQVINAAINIENKSSITIFRLNTSTGVWYTSPITATDVFNHLDTRDPMTVGPSDVENYAVHYRALTPDQYLKIADGSAALVFAGKFTYLDAAGNNHERYICTMMVGTLSIGLIRSTQCPTPPQS